MDTYETTTNARGEGNLSDPEASDIESESDSTCQSDIETEIISL